MLTQLINARILTPQGWLKDGSVLNQRRKNFRSNQLRPRRYRCTTD